jgi:hypothetical protein
MISRSYAAILMASIGLLASLGLTGAAQIKKSNSAAAPAQIKKTPGEPSVLLIDGFLPLPDGKQVVVLATTHKPKGKQQPGTLAYELNTSVEYRMHSNLYSLDLGTHALSLIRVISPADAPLMDWVNDGKAIIGAFRNSFSEIGSKDFGILLVNLKTGKTRAVIDPIPVSDYSYTEGYYSPVLNPKRDALLYERRDTENVYNRLGKENNAGPPIEWRDVSAWTADLQGKRRQLIGDELAPLGWSSDGNWVYVAAKPPAKSDSKTVSFTYDVSAKNIATHATRQLTDTHDLLGWHPLWALRKILFARLEGTKNKPAISLWLMPELGGEPELILRENLSNNRLLTNLVPSPDGKAVAFGGKQMWVLDLESRKITQITKNAGTWLIPAWLPDSKRIIFLKRADSYKDSVWLADLRKPGDFKCLWP